MAPTLQPTPPAPQVSAPPVRSRPWLASAWPWLLIAALYLAASVGPAVFDQNEAQYAGAVREMLNLPGDYLASTRTQLERGQWYVPTNDGVPRLQKPPLVYWFLMASMRTFGINDFAARLPNALFCLLWFWALFLLGRRIAGREYGVAAAMILATMAGTFIFGHLIAPEPYLGAFLTLTFWCFLAACQEPWRAGRWMFAAWMFMGLGVACKGLHGAIYPLAVAGWLAWRCPETRPVWRKLLVSAGPWCVLALLAPWYAAIEAKYPGFLRDQFINEQLGHAINRRYPVDNTPVSFYVFWLEHLVLFLPWTFFLPAAWRLRGAHDRRPGHAAPRELLRGWFWITAASLLFSSLQDYYLMTAWGTVALWLARAWTDDGESVNRQLPRWMSLGPGWCLAGMGTLILTAGVFLLAHERQGAGVITAVTSAKRDTVLATLTGFSASAWHSLLPIIWVAGAVFLVGGLAGRWLAAHGRWRAVLKVTAATMVLALAMAARGLTVLEDYFSSKNLALTVNRVARADASVFCDGQPCDNPSLLFYLNREIYWFGERASREFATRKLGIGKTLFVTDEEFALRWKSARSAFLICEADDVVRWRERLGTAPVKQLGQSGTRVLLVNQPPL